MPMLLETLLVLYHYMRIQCDLFTRRCCKRARKCMQNYNLAHSTSPEKVTRKVLRPPDTLYLEVLE